MNAAPLPGPSGPASLLAVRRLLSDPAPELDRLAASYGRTVQVGAGPLRIAVVGDAPIVTELLARPVSDFRWGFPLNVLTFVVGPESLLVSDGAAHRRRRAAVGRGFARRRLLAWIPMILDRAQRTADGILADAGRAGGGPVDVTAHSRALTIAVVVEALLGSSLARRAPEIADRFERPQQYLESPAVRQIPHPLPRTRRARVRHDREALDRIIDEEIVALRAAGRGDRGDVLAEMVSTGELTDRELRDQVVSLIGAGYATTSAALCWTLWAAATEPGLWRRLGEEADAALAAPAGDDTLAALPLAGRTVRETLRLYPPAIGGVRQTTVDLVVGGYAIPAHTTVLWSSYLTGRDPAVWQDPLRFDPDRFADLGPEQRSASQRHWAPFGAGARNCLGFGLAEMELTLSLATLARRLDLAPAREGIPRPVGMVVSRPAGGAPFLVGARTGGKAVAVGRAPVPGPGAPGVSCLDARGDAAPADPA